MANLTSVLVQLREERTQAQQQVEKLDEVIAVIQELVGRDGSASGGQRQGRGRRTLSAAARRKIAAAQRARWARVRSQEQPKTSRQKKHWSQLPENKTRVLQLVKRMNRARLAA